MSYTYYCFTDSSCGIPVCVNAGGTQGYCPSGYTQKLDLGSWGFCCGSGFYGGVGNYLLPPGGSCGADCIYSLVVGRAYVCSQSGGGGGDAQTLSISGQTLSISEGNSVSLPSGGGDYCYTYYSTSTSSCVCPDGETNKKDLGSWGFCRYSSGSSTYDYFRLPGRSCRSMGGPTPVTDTDQGLASVSCEE